MLEVLRALFGLAVLLGLLWLISENRRMVNWRLVGIGVGLQAALAGIILLIPGADLPIRLVSDMFIALLGFTDEGTRFVFGFLGAGPDFWNDVNSRIAADDWAGFGLVFAFKILPTVIFFSALTSILYYLNILQKVVWGFAWVLRRTLGLSGTESLAAAANVFVGQTEAPLVVKPYVKQMTRSELACLMTGGLATIAGGVFGAYVFFLGGTDPEAQREFAKHLLTASIISAPAAIVCAKILVPETGEINPDLRVNKEQLGTNVFDAAAVGTSQGLQLALYSGAMLITFIALVALVNALLGNVVGHYLGLNGLIESMSGGRYDALGLEVIFGYAFAPLAWLIGVSPGELLNVGELLGQKLVLNEFVAYLNMGVMLANETMTDTRSIIITTYALCGFASFGSIGILLGGISPLAPDRRSDLSQLAMRALAGGTVACLMTGAIAGVFLG